jgi:hypothetical protein
MKAILITWLLAASTSLALDTPTGLKAEWTSSRDIKLTWNDNSLDEDGYIIQRRVGTGTVWGNLTPTASANSTTFTDTTIAASGTFTVYFYRVRARNATLTTGAPPAEVVIAGKSNDGSYDDSDADGIADVIEGPATFLAPDNWADASADHDGDGVPNAWELSLGTSMTDPALYPLRTVLVDPQAPVQTADVVWTITAALAKVASTTAHPNNSFRIIRVKPGIYRENIAKTVICNVAILPERSSVQDHFEIQGIDAVDPVISVATGSLVIDGFVISRAPGTRGPVVTSTEETNPTNRMSIVRLVNCLISNADAGTQPVVFHPRGRLVMSHCTFYMNQTATGAVAHSYGTGLISGATGLETTARMKAQNCVFWNPVSTLLPELQSAGESAYTNCIAYQTSVAGVPLIPAGCTHTNPVLNPRGYLSNEFSAAASGGEISIGVLKDIHGEFRTDPTGRGADEWYDTDSDGIPDFADAFPTSTSNAIADEDTDGLSDLVEYLSGTNVYGADSPYLTVNQAFSMFMPQTGAGGSGGYFTKSETYDLFYTKTAAQNEFFNKTASDGRYFLKSEGVVRVPPAGDIDMGEFTGTPTP